MGTPGAGGVGMPTWWEGIGKARDRIRALSPILGSLPSLDALLESERPAKALLDDSNDDVGARICDRLALPSSGHADDTLCQWLYDTYQTGDADLQSVVLRFIPTVCGLYLSRVIVATKCGRGVSDSPPLAGFEAVLLALYASETKTRGGRPVTVNIPDLSQPSLYHSPRLPSASTSTPASLVGCLSAPLEPQLAVKATKRACIVGVALDLFNRKIAFMPKKAKIEACYHIQRWAGQQPNSPSPVLLGLGDSTSESIPTNGVVNGTSSPTTHSKNQRAEANGSILLSSSPDQTERQLSTLSISDGDEATPGKLGLLGPRIPLPWELLQPIIKLLGHCLMAPLNVQEVRDAALVATRAVYARATHDIIPEAILATGSLLRLDEATRASARSVVTASSIATPTPSKPRKPEILLVSK